jgi:hypothetical protein
MEPLIVRHVCPLGNVDPTEFSRVFDGSGHVIAVECLVCGAHLPMREPEVA